MLTISWPRSVFSCLITQVAPFGMGAPVMSRTQVPSVTAASLASPAIILSITFSVTGVSREAPFVSSALRAYPSSGERSNGGCMISDVTSFADTKPAALPVGTSPVSLICVEAPISVFTASSIDSIFISCYSLLKNDGTHENRACVPSVSLIGVPLHALFFNVWKAAWFPL